MKENGKNKNLMMDEIPTALREIERPKSKPIQSPSLNFIPILTGLGLGFFAILLLSLIIFKNIPRLINSQEITNRSPQVNTSPPIDQNNSTQIPSQPTTNNQPENILGHLPYQEAKADELANITNDGRLKLRKSAAEKFLKMQSDAKANGINLIPISAFRSISEQESLFFDVKEKRGQVTSKRAEVSAPPGYSEHHTGYAIDIGDGNNPATNLSPSFAQTEAYQWLVTNAPRYSFELSFTPDNLQGVSYEPWHWRFVGDTDSLETFYKARNLDSKIK